METWFIAYALLGLFAGFLAGLLGIGGGGLMVPILVMIFGAQMGFVADDVMHLALGTSMAAIVFTAISSVYAHHQHGAVRWNVFWAMTPGILFGTLIGTRLVAHISGKSLALIFAGLFALIALQMLSGRQPHPHRELPAAPVQAGVGVFIGIISCLIAIGGGVMTVPFLTWCNVKMQQAVATSAAVGLPIALGGSIGYVLNGWGHPGLPPYSLGFVYLPAVLGIALVSMLTAPVGARLSHRLPVKTLKKIFAVILVGLATKMAWSVIGK